MNWIGFDLDGTLARYDGWVSINHIGEPIQPMVALVQEFLQNGMDVRVFTARANNGDEAIAIIQDWCKQHIGVALPVTCHKDMFCLAIYDDRAISVEKNTGKILSSWDWRNEQ